MRREPTPGLVESICDEASQATNLDDFGDDWFLNPLARGPRTCPSRTESC
jgi:hypothetical protein